MQAELNCVQEFHGAMEVSASRPFPNNKALKDTELSRMVEAFQDAAKHCKGRLKDDPDARYLRLHLLCEELYECATAILDGNEVEAFDGLIDLLYVLLGTATTYNWPLTQGFAEVHASNMTKAPQADDPYRERVEQKGANYVAPNLKAVLEQHQNANQ